MIDRTNFRSGRTIFLLAAISLVVVFVAVVSCIPDEILQAPGEPQEVWVETITDTHNEVFDVVENMPTPAGGNEGWNQYLSENLRYPSKAKKEGIEGTVYVAFIVNSDGSVRDAEILRGIGGGCDEEALKVIKNAPQWEPGTQRDKKINVRIRLPIRFALLNNSREEREGTLTSTGSEVFDVVETMPSLVGGTNSWNQYLAGNLQYPSEAKKKGIEGIVYVAFIVNNDGTVSNAEILRGIGGGCDEEALKVVKNSPKWDPGIQRDQKVNVKMRIPIRFALDM